MTKNSDPAKKKGKYLTDPHAEREAKHYANPIPSREFILNILTEHDSSLSFTDIAEKLSLIDPDQIEALRRRLRAMQRDSQVMCDRNGHYQCYATPELIIGNINFDRDGNGYVKYLPDNIVIHGKQLQGLWPNDEIAIEIVGRTKKGRLEGRITEVRQRNTHKIIGYFQCCDEVSFVRPQQSGIQHVIIIEPGFEKNAEVDQLVEVDISIQPTPFTQPVGKVSRIIGDQLTASMAVELIVQKMDLLHEWPKPLLQEISTLPTEVDATACTLIAEADLAQSNYTQLAAGYDCQKEDVRIDIRHLPLMTIDGADARDFDDAVCALKQKDGWRLIVAIADVSHYVRLDSALDDHAQLRSTSVYFPGQVIPMLPEALSNELCSLKPKVDRFCLVCDLSITEKGEVSSSQFYPAVMHSHARLTYDEVQAWREGEQNQISTLAPSSRDSLTNLYDLYSCMLDTRLERGALDFELSDAQIDIDDSGHVAGMIPVKRLDSHRLIEECMLLANVATAYKMLKHERPGVYRTHAAPSEQRLEDLKSFVQLAGLRWTVYDGDITPQALADIVNQAKDRPDKNMIQMMVLRSLMQAEYSPDNIGHFGLAYPAYSHFTSPIRRYPDLITHRVIKHLISPKNPSGFHYAEEALVKLCEQCSINERKAEEASREVVSILKCVYMQQHVGEVFDSVIANVLSFGFFAQIPELLIDGLVHVSNLGNDYYEYDSTRQCLVGRSTNMTYVIGQAVKVRVVRVDVTSGKIDFELVNSSLPVKRKSTSGKKSAANKTKKSKNSTDKPKKEKKPKASKKAKAKKRNDKVKSAKKNKKK